AGRGVAFAADLLPNAVDDGNLLAVPLEGVLEARVQLRHRLRVALDILHGRVPRRHRFCGQLRQQRVAAPLDLADLLQRLLSGRRGCVRRRLLAIERRFLARLAFAQSCGVIGAQRVEALLHLARERRLIGADRLELRLDGIPHAVVELAEVGALLLESLRQPGPYGADDIGRRFTCALVRPLVRVPQEATPSDPRPPAIDMSPALSPGASSGWSSCRRASPGSRRLPWRGSASAPSRAGCRARAAPSGAMSTGRPCRATCLRPSRSARTSRRA